MLTKKKHRLSNLCKGCRLHLAVLVLLTVCLLAACVHAGAASAYYVWVNGVQLYSGEYLPSGSTTKTTVKPSGTYAYFENGTLTLNGFTCTSSSSSAVSASGDLKVVFSGTNRLTSAASTYTTAGISVSGHLTIEGSGGSLSLTAGKNTYSNGYSRGIYADNLTVSGIGAIYAYGSSAPDHSAGVWVESRFEKSGSISVSGTGGSQGTTSNDEWKQSWGIHAGSLIISGGSVSGTGGTSITSRGVYVSSLTLHSGSLTAKAASSSAIETSIGLEASSSVTVNGGTLTATGQSAKGSFGIDTGTFTVAGGTVKATGGSASGTASSFYDHGSWGIRCDRLTVSSGSVTARSSTASYTDGWSYGIETDSYTISGGTVSGTAGQSVNGSYGIYGGSISATGGTTTGTGGRSTTYNSCGVYGSVSNLSGSASITGTGGSATPTTTSEYGNTQSSYGLYLRGSSMNIGGSTALKGTASAAKYQSIGVYLYNTSKVTMSGSASIYAKGGNCDTYSYGLRTYSASFDLNDSATITAIACSNTVGSAMDNLYPVAKYTVSANISGTDAETSTDPDLPYDDWRYAKLTSVFKYTISLSRNNTSAGTVYGAGSYLPGATARISVSTKSGYTFDGWYEGDELYSTSTAFTITVTRNLSLTARWTRVLTPVSAPAAVTGLVYNGTVQTGVPAGTGYTLSGHTATAAGTYTATATLRSGYKWADGSVAALKIEWRIAPAQLALTAPQAVAGLQYTGEAQTLITAGSADNATLYYRLSGGEWRTGLPQATDCGTYTVEYYAQAASSNYQSLGSAESPWGSIPCAIALAGGPAAPGGLTVTAPSVLGGQDGAIHGVSAGMEYAASPDFSDAQPCTGSDITNLPAGTYYIRIPETATHEAGDAAVVVIPDTNLPRVPGDANVDGQVDLEDVLCILRCDAGETVAISRQNADVNADGKADMQDALLISQLIAGWNVTLK